MGSTRGRRRPAGEYADVQGCGSAALTAGWQVDATAVMMLDAPNSRTRCGRTEKVMRKRRTREHVIADLGVNHVERFVLRCGWTVERARFDYGIDLMVRTFAATGDIENGEVKLQVKATESVPRSPDRSTIPLRLEWRDMLFWVSEPVPVIVALYDAADDRAVWLDVREHFRKRQWARRAASSTTVTVHIPAASVLDEAAVRLFARLRDERLHNP